MEKSQIFSLMVGLWYQLLSARMDLPPIGRHGSCPVCGGRDRFRFSDYQGRGGSYCSQCEPHSKDGLQLLMSVENCTFPAALIEVGRWLGMAPENRPQARTVVTTTTKSNEDPKEKARRCIGFIKSKSLAIAGTPSEQYLIDRGFSHAIGSSSFRHLQSWKFQGNRESPALVVLFRDTENKIVWAELRSVGSGEKMKYTTSHIRDGVGFFAGTKRGNKIVLCEGFGTALALDRVATDSTVLAVGCARKLKSITAKDIPAGREIIIAGDLDKNGEGQSAAIQLLGYLRGLGFKAVVKFPPFPDGVYGDWDDYFLQNKQTFEALQR